MNSTFLRRMAMKKKSIFGLIFSSFSLLLGAAAGALLNQKANEPVKEAEASANIGFDSVDTDNYYYHQSGSDASSVNLSSMIHNTTASYYQNTMMSSISEGATLTLKTAYTKTFDAYFIPVRMYITVPDYQTVRFKDIEFKMTMTKIADAGSAPAIAELIRLEGNSIPTSFSTGNSDTTTTNSIMRLRTTSCNAPVNKTTTSFTALIDKHNTAGTVNNLWLDLGLLIVGCYGSSYYNQVEVTLTTLSNNCSFIENSFYASNGASAIVTTDFYDALGQFNTASSSNSVLRLLADYEGTSNVPAYYMFSKTGTLDLNGHKIDRKSATYLLQVSNNSTLTISGNGVLTGSSSGIYIASGSTLNIESGVTVACTGSTGIYNYGTTTIKGTVTASSGLPISNKQGTVYLDGATISSSVANSRAILNDATLHIKGTTSITVPASSKQLSVTSGSFTYIYGSDTISKIAAERNSYIYLYNGSTRYTGGTISLTFDENLQANDTVFYAYNSSDVSKVTVTNTLASYLSYSYNSSNKKYSVIYSTFTLTVSMTHGSYTVNKNTLTYAETAIISYNLDEGYELGNSSVSYTNCTTVVDKTNSKITVKNSTGNPTVTITPVKIALKVFYYGNGYNSITPNYDTVGYAKDSGTGYAYEYGDTVTVLKNAFGKSGQVFANWNTKADGSGQSYDEDDTFVIHETTNLYAQWVDSDDTVVANFVNTYMHMTDYTGDGDGSCISHEGGDGYYVIAKRALVVLTNAQITLFRTDNKYSAAKLRYEKWAYYNNDLDYAYVNDFTHIGSSRNNIKPVTETNVWLIVCVASVATLSFVGLFFIFRKKRLVK